MLEWLLDVTFWPTVENITIKKVRETRAIQA